MFPKSLKRAAENQKGSLNPITTDMAPGKGIQISFLHACPKELWPKRLLRFYIQVPYNISLRKRVPGLWKKNHWPSYMRIFLGVQEARVGEMFFSRNSEPNPKHADFSPAASWRLSHTTTDTVWICPCLTAMDPWQRTWLQDSMGLRTRFHSPGTSWTSLEI